MSVLVFIGGLLLVVLYVATYAWALGAGADFWGPARRRYLPKLDAWLSRRFSGELYAENTADPDEFVGIVRARPERVERWLYRLGYRWNFASGLKTDPDGRVEYSSWASRRFESARLRRLVDATRWVPVVGVVPEIVEGVLARRQVHVTLFEVGGDTLLYVHDEPNALNPLLFAAHYRGADSLLGREVSGRRPDAGIRAVALDLLGADRPLELSATGAGAIDIDELDDGALEGAAGVGV